MDPKARLNTTLGPNTFGFDAPGRFFFNLEAPALYEEAIQRHEAMVTSGGALLAETGVHTGRSHPHHSRWPFRCRAGGLGALAPARWHQLHRAEKQPAVPCRKRLQRKGG